MAGSATSFALCATILCAHAALGFQPPAGPLPRMALGSRGSTVCSLPFSSPGGARIGLGARLPAPLEAGVLRRGCTLRMTSTEKGSDGVKEDRGDGDVNMQADVAGELKEIEENMLASLRRRRRLMKRLGVWEQMRGVQDKEEDEDFIGTINTFCTCEEYNMPHALRRLRIWSGGEARFVDGGRVLHVRKVSRANSKEEEEGEGGLSQADVEGDIFIFAYGVVVCWGLPENLLKELLDISQVFSREVYDAPEEDDFSYTYGKAFNYHSAKDQLVLETPFDGSDESEERAMLEKLAASHGFAQSAKLSSFAESVQSSIIATRGLAAELAREGDIKSQSQRDIARNLGQLVLDRHTIYLYADVLDSPDVCWENPEVDPLYKLVEQFLELKPRVELLNRRVEVVRELLSLLSDELKNKHASRLEEIIIYLIMIEIVLSLIKDIVPFVSEVIQNQVALRGAAKATQGAVTSVVASAASISGSSETLVAIIIFTIIGVALSGALFAGFWIWLVNFKPMEKFKKFIRKSMHGTTRIG